MNSKADLGVPLTSKGALGEVHPTNEEHLQSNALNENNSKKDTPPELSEENYRLVGRSPLLTIVFLSIGPFISQVVSSMYGIVATIWVSKSLGDVGMAAVSLFTNLDNVGRAFGYFMNCSASQKISSLFGENKHDEAGQVICDLFRCSLLSGMFVPAALLPFAKPLGRWFGADDQTLSMAFEYLAVLLGCSTVSCLFLMFCGCLQAEGRTAFVSLAQISSFIMNMAIFCPLFLIVFKLGTKGAALATIVSEGIPTAFLFCLYFFHSDDKQILEEKENELEDIDENNISANKTKSKKCLSSIYKKIRPSCKPKLSGLFKRFSPHTWPALSVGVSQLASNCSRSLPSILQRKFMGMITQNIDTMTFTDAMAGFNAVIRMAQLTDGFRLAISMSLLPASSFAYSSKSYTRLLYLVFHACWINLVFGLIAFAVAMSIPQYIAMIFSKTKSFLAAATPMIRNTNVEAPITWIRFIIQTFLQSLCFGGTATIFSVISYFFVNIGVYCLLYYTDKTNVPRMMYAYVISSGISIFVGAFCLIQPIRTLYKKIKEEKQFPSEASNNMITPLNDNKDLTNEMQQPFVDNPEPKEEQRSNE